MSSMEFTVDIPEETIDFWIKSFIHDIVKQKVSEYFYTSSGETIEKRRIKDLVNLVLKEEIKALIEEINYSDIRDEVINRVSESVARKVNARTVKVIAEKIVENAFIGDEVEE